MSEAKQAQALNISPYFFVSDLVAAAEHYRDKLGFVFDRYWGDPPVFVMVRRDRVQLMLRGPNHGGRPQPNRALDCDTWDAYLYVRDADALHAELSRRGATILRPPEDQGLWLPRFRGARPRRLRHLLRAGFGIVVERVSRRVPAFGGRIVRLTGTVRRCTLFRG